MAGSGTALKAVAFCALFVAYQLPEGIGQRVFGRLSVVAGLFLLFYGVAFVVARILCRDVLRAYALEPRRGIGAATVGLFGCAVFLKMASIVAGLWSGIYTGSGAHAPAMTPLAAGLAMTLVPSLAEDIVTRGFWFRAAGIRWTPRSFVLASSGIYVLNHVYRIGLGPGEWVMLFAFGIAYALAVVRFDSLWAAVGLHWGWNYGNEAAAAVWQLSVTSTSGVRVLAIACHALMAVIVLMATPVSIDRTTRPAATKH